MKIKIIYDIDLDIASVILAIVVVVNVNLQIILFHFEYAIKMACIQFMLKILNNRIKLMLIIFI